MIGRTTYIDYEENERLVIRLCVRMENQERRTLDVYGIRPYGFFPAGKKELPDVVTEREEGYEGYDGVSLDKIYTKFPGETKEVEEKFDQSYEADIPFYRRCSIDGLSGHIEIPDDSERKHDNLTGDEIHIKDIDQHPEVEEPITPRTVMGDIEVIPDHSLSFQKMTENASQPIVNITLYDPYDDEYVAIVLDSEGEVDGKGVKGYVEQHWEDTDYSEYGGDFGYTLKRCSDEASLLNAFIGWMEEKRPDLISGWNFVDFDHEYLLRRMKKFSRVNQHRLSDIGAVGSPDYNIERAIDGLPSFDMMDAMVDKMTFHDWKSRSLDYVANEELGIGKVEDISIKKSYDENPTRLLAYNIIDTQLLVALDDVNGIHDFFYELSDLCGIPIYDSFSEMRLVDGYIMSRRGSDEVLPSAVEEELDAPAGGLVLSPSDGVLDNIGVFDLKSLYPSVIITANISPETRVPMEEADVTIPAMVEKEDDVHGKITEENIKWAGEAGAMGYSLEEEGLIPKYIKKLFKNRGRAKSLRNDHDQDSLRYKMWDRRQRSIKVVMNSFYGVMASPYWRLAKNGLGDSVTGGGRYTLWVGSQVAREMGYDVKYGDSIPAKEPILIRDAGEIEIIEIQELDDTEGVEVWSNGGFTSVNEVIKKPKTKDLYRVKTGDGMVTVTEDHSLVDTQKEEVKPRSVDSGDSLLHEDLSNVESASTRSISENQAWVYGFFVGDGHCKIHDGEGYSSRRASWHINKKDEELLERVQEKLEEAFDIESKIVDIRDSSGVFRLYAESESVVNLVEEWREKCYSGSQKRVPSVILNGSESTKKAFLEGYQASDGDNDERYDKLFHRAYTKDRTLAAGICLLVKQLGDEYNIDVRDNHGTWYPRIASVSYNRGDQSEVKEVKKVESDCEYVYDLETENHHFNAGIGSMIVHNTDSVMISLTDEEPNVPTEDLLDRGKEVEGEINQEMKNVVDNFGIPNQHPHLDGELHGTERHTLSYEFEKLYRRFFQAGSKKRYAGLITWKEGKTIDPPQIDTVGFESNRSDYSAKVAEVQPKVIRMVLEGKAFEKVSNYISSISEGLRERTVDIHDFASPGTINKPLEQYPNRPTKRACLYSNKWLDANWAEGDEPWIIPIRDTPPGYPKTDVIAVEWNEDLPEGFQVDIPHILEKTLEQPLEPILNEINWLMEEMITGTRTKELEFGDDEDSNPFSGDSKALPQNPEMNSDGSGSSDKGSERTHNGVF